jgi:murein DD-endopeptidase MepM/ murein hydrolase activator NlpD
MKRWISCLICPIILLAAWLALPVRSVLAAPVAPALSLTVTPTNLIPAQAGYAYVGGGYPLQVSITLDGAPLDVFWTGEGYLAMFAFGFDEPPGEHALAVKAHDPATGVSLDTVTTLTVLDFTYPLEQVALPYRLIPLLDPALNQGELDRLSAVFAARTRPAQWDWPYALPIPLGVVTSRFGGDRVYNGGMLSAHHTGVDFRRAIGEPVHATADGRVALVDFFDVRGNVVIIDHGYGAFSLYAHLSGFYVQPGEFVRQGQIIAAAGGTGRSNGPHLHFEVIVNGIPVDPIRWLALNPDFIPPREITPERAEPVD